MKKEIFTYSPEETEQIAYELALAINNGECEFIAMYGDLGVGKTAFVRGLARVFSPNARVKSPTFTIVNEYNGGKIPFYHFDVYRLEDVNEFYAIGGEEYFSSGICLIEWGELIEEALPDNCIRISFEKDSSDENIRYLKIN